MDQNKWERTYGDRMREVCKSIDELHDLVENGTPVLAVVVKTVAEEVVELESAYLNITGSDDYPTEMLRARIQLKEIQDETKDTDE